MDANIKTAANHLHRAAYNIRTQITEIRGQVLQDTHGLHGEERQVSRSLFQSEAALAGISSGGVDVSMQKQQLAKRIIDLRKHHSELKSREVSQRMLRQNQIRALQAQADRLEQIAHTLEMWS